MEQRVSLITLGVRDVDRARDFYAALGWRGQTVEGTVFFQAGGVALVLWSRDLLAAEAGVRLADGPRSIVLAQNVRSPAEVDEVLAAAVAAGGTMTSPAATTFYGGYAGYVTDPDGHVWEIAHNPGLALAEDGSLTLPDFGT